MQKYYYRITSWFKEDFFRKLLKNIVTLISGNMGAALLGLVSLTLSLKVLGITTFGIFTVIQTYVLVFDGLLNFQSWEAIIRYGTIAKASNDIELLKGYIKLGFFIDLSSAIFGTFCAYLLTGYFGAKFLWSDEIILFTRIFSITILFNLSGTFIGILRIYGEFKAFSFQKIISAILKLIGVIIAFIFHGSLFYFILITIITKITGNIILIVMANRVCSINGISGWWKSNIKDSKEFLKFAFWTNINSTVAIPYREMDKIIAGTISYEAVAVYKLFKQIASMVGKIVAPIYQATYPELATLISEKKYKEGFSVVKKIAVIILVSGVALWIIVAPLSPVWLRFFFGKEIASSWVLLSIFLGITVITNSFVALDPLFVALGYIKYKFILNVSGSIIYLGLAYFLSIKIGLLGIILAGLVQSLWINGLKIFLLHKNKKSISTKEYS